MIRRVDYRARARFAPRARGRDLVAAPLPARSAERAKRRLAVASIATVVALVIALTLTASAAMAYREYVPGTTFGAPGTGNGQFEEPTAVAVNDSLTEATAGDVYVLDRGNNRVEWFSASGEYKGQFNGGETPAGSFSEPTEIAVDNSGRPLEDPSAGDVYVLEHGLHLIDKFTAEGKYLSQLTETTVGAPFRELASIAVGQSG